MAHALAGLIGDIHDEGTTSLGGIASALNGRGVASPRGGMWTATAVRRVLARLEPEPAEA